MKKRAAYTYTLLDELLASATEPLPLAKRTHQGGMPIRLDAPGIHAVRAVLEDYAAILDAVPARVMIRAHRLTERRISAILTGKRRPHDVEVMDL